MQTLDSNQNYFNPFMDDPLFTVEQAAEYCKVSVTTINVLLTNFCFFKNIKVMSGYQYL